MMTSKGADLLSWPHESITSGGAIVLTQSDELLPFSTWLDVEEKMLVRKHASKIAKLLNGNELTLSND
jgi:hypothetical protein